MPITIDESRSPTLRINYRGKITDDDVTKVLAGIDAWAQRGAPFLVLVDTTDSDSLSPAQRKRIADSFQRPDLGRSLRGCAVVVKSALTRGIATALTWVQAPNFPLKMFSTVEESEKWLRGQLENT